jgi:uncharacterized repeat protein (TIGR01451 family)
VSRLLRVLVAVQLGLLTMATATPVAATGPYTIVDLGTLGGSGSSAAAVNEMADVAGTSLTSSGEHQGFRWRDGVMTGIHSMGGWGAEAFDISDDGWVVGSAGTSAGPVVGMYWFGADPHPIGTLGGSRSQAFAINNDHVIVGRSPNAGGIVEAFRWEGGAIAGLGGLVEGDYSEAWDLNDAGTIVGESRAVGGSVHAVRWQNGVIEDLGTPSPNFDSSWARGISADGTIVGGTYVANGGSLHPFVYVNGSWDVVTELPGYADAVNASGQVVGTYFTNAGELAFLYEDGVVTDLNDLLPAGSGWELHAATDINDAGQIVGQGMHDGEARGFLLSPVEPSADLAITGSANTKSLKTGQTVSYTFSVVNHGPDAAGAVAVTNALPSGLELISASSTIGACSGSAIVTCPLGTMPGGGVATVTVTARVTAGGGTSVTNTASVSSAVADPVPGNDSAAVTLDVRGKPRR